MLEAVSLTKYFDRRAVVEQLSFKVCTGEVLGIVGPSGAGKSTILKILAGISEPDIGYARICGFDVQTQAVHAKRLIGYLPEGLHGYDKMSVSGVLNFIAQVRGLSAAAQRSRIADVVGQLQLEPVLYDSVGTLSKSDSRLLGLAQAILHEPPVLLLDNPTEGLDANQQQRVRSMIAGYSANKSIIVATRLLDEVMLLCNRLLIVADGQLLADALPLELQNFSRYRQAVTLIPAQPLDLLALAVLPGVAGIEEDQRTPYSITVLAKPGYVIFPGVYELIIARQWNIRSLAVDSGRLEDVFYRITRSRPR